MTYTEHEELFTSAFDEALKLRDAGQLEAALARLQAVEAELLPNDVQLGLHVQLQLGNICTKLRDPVGRERHFRRATEIVPISELASLGLFHALVRKDDWIGAMREMVRLVKLRDSHEYRELLAGYGNHLPAHLRPFADEARTLLARYS